MISSDLQKKLALIRQQAVTDLGKNKTQTEEGAFFPAGLHHFQSFWARDFCLAVPGLLRINETETVGRQLRRLLQFKTFNGFLVRGFDTIDPKLRVFRYSILRFLPGRWPDHTGPLKPEFLGEHGTPAFDSNALTLSAICQWAEKSPEDYERLAKDFPLADLLKGYLPHLRDGLVYQEGFSDWQDSAKREGLGLFVNLTVLKAAIAAKRKGLEVPAVLDPGTLARRIHNVFFNRELGLYSQFQDRVQIPLESNLWIADENLLPDMTDLQKLRGNLQNHAVWKNLGVPASPETPGEEVAWTTKIVGLRHYHDRLAWSWLLSDQAAVAARWGNTETLQKIVDAQAKAVESYQCIHEVYRWQDGKLIPFRSPLYVSEGPFTWGSGRWIGAIDFIS